MHTLNSRERRTLGKMCERDPLPWVVKSGKEKAACERLVELGLAVYQGDTGTRRWKYRQTALGKSQCTLMEAET